MLIAAMSTVIAPTGAGAADVEIVNPGFEQLEPGGTITGWRILTELSSEGASFQCRW